jgi:hypothetical protein
MRARDVSAPVASAIAFFAAAALASCGAPQRIFDGQSLAGWTQILDSKWRVEDGALVARQDPSGRREGESWLLSDRDYGDFILELEFRITPGGNSGVFIRDPLPRAQRAAAADGGNAPWDIGYEVNINNDEPNYPTGSVWATAKGRPKLQKENAWNRLVIKLQGQRLWTWVNGEPALDAVELPARSTRGAIGFQRHGGAQYRDKVVEFREVAIREL